jgi:carbonic anhydrase
MTSYQEIFENNRLWVEKKSASDKDFLKKLSKDQDPDFLYIGCSDSRVPANEMMGVEPGEVFVHRNIANLVNNVDLNVMTVINYAVRILSVKYIVICGHYGCGGVKAAMQAKDLGILNPWLRTIRDVYRLHQQELDAIPGDDERYRRLVELNVYEQALNVIKTAAVQQSYSQNGYPKVAGWVFDLHNGMLKDLKLDFPAMLRNIQKIYNLTGKDLA